MRTSVVPLFDGYLFFQADAEGRQAALSTGHLAQAIAVADQENLHWQLQAIFRVCAETVHLELVDFIKPGKTVRIIGGPFTGLSGVVCRINTPGAWYYTSAPSGRAWPLRLG